MLRGVASAPVKTCVMSLMLLSLLAGCGGDDNSGPSKEVQSLRIEQFQQDIGFFCISGRKDLVGAADPLGTLITAVDNLIKIYRDDPDATYRVAKIDKRGDKQPVREISIRRLLTESRATLDKNCG